MSDRISARERKEIIGFYRSGLGIREIATQTGRGLSTVKYIIEDIKDDRFCPKCHTELPPNAKFCFNCGVRILTRAEEIAEHLSALKSCFSALPASQRDKFILSLNEAIQYLRERTPKDR